MRIFAQTIPFSFFLFLLIMKTFKTQYNTWDCATQETRVYLRTYLLSLNLTMDPRFFLHVDPWMEESCVNLAAVIKYNQ